MGRYKVAAVFIVPDALEGIAGLLMAREWEKAAIVYAWTSADSVGGRPPKTVDKRVTNGTVYGIREFAALSLAGLSSTTTVMRYRAAWVWAIENGLAEVIGPGDEVDMTLLHEQPFPAPGRPEPEPDVEVKAKPAAAKRVADKGAGHDTRRSEHLDKIERLSAELVVETTDWAQKYRHVDEGEIAQVHRIGDYLLEAARQVASFAAKQEENKAITAGRRARRSAPHRSEAMPIAS